MITNAATGDSNAKGLVYVDAFGPAKGQIIGKLAGAVPGFCAAGSSVTLAPCPGAPSGSEDA